MVYFVAAEWLYDSSTFCVICMEMKSIMVNLLLLMLLSLFLGVGSFIEEMVPFECSGMETAATLC